MAMAVLGRRHLLLLLPSKRFVCDIDLSQFLGSRRLSLSQYKQPILLHSNKQANCCLRDGRRDTRFGGTSRDMPWPKARYRGTGGPVRSSDDRKTSQETSSELVTRVVTFLRGVLKVVGVVILVAGIVIAGIPTFLSWPIGLDTAVSFMNSSIPGTVSVKSASLGWMKPALVEGIKLQDVDGKDVFVISKLETKVPLWSIAFGRTGSEKWTIMSHVIDPRPKEKSTLLQLALVVAPEDRFLPLRHGDRKQLPVKERPVKFDFKTEAITPNGALDIVQGEILLPADSAVFVGKSALLKVSTGPWAIDLDDDLRDTAVGTTGVPIKAVLRTNFLHADAAGMLDTRKGRVQLIRPMYIESDLTPEFARMYLARVNPLLGDILGPAVREEDITDFAAHVSPVNLVLPADKYVVHIEPVKAILRRGAIVDGIFSLLSKQKSVAPAKRELTMQTSQIVANVDTLKGDLECARMDILLSDNIHVASWGHVNWKQETMRITIAIPASTLSRLPGLADLPGDYCLKIPVRGTFEKPAVDWKSAAVGIAQLTLQQAGGGAFINIWKVLDGKKEGPIPKPQHPLPWS